MVFNSQNGAVGFNAKWFGAHTVKDIQKISTATDEKFGAYLKNLNGAKASVAGYSASLVGATIKTVALQAASMALNAAITWGVSLAIQGLITGIQWLVKNIPTVANLTRKLKETADAFKEAKDEITSLNDELTTTQDRINELKAKGTLSFTEASELKRLEAENAERAHTIWLLEQENKERAKSAQILFNKSAKVDPNKDLSYFHDDKDTGNFLTDFANDYNSSNSYSANTVEAYRDMLDNLFASGYEYGSDATTDKKIDDIYRIIDAYDAYCGATDTLYATIAARPKYAKANEEIQNLFEAGNLNSESLSNLYNTNESVKEFVDYLFSLGTTDAKNVTEFLSLLPGEFKKIENSAENAAGALATFASDYDSIKKDIEGLTDAYEQMTEKGSISAETLFDILDKYPEIIDSLKMENGQYQISANLLKETINAKIQDKIASYTAARSNIANSKEEIKANIEKTKSIIANIKAKKEEIRTSLLSGDSKYSVIDLVRIQKELNKNDNLSALEKDLADYENYTKKIAVLSNLNINSFLSGSSSNSGKTAAEKYFDKQKYLLETNQITQEEYLKRINQKYKEFYKNQGDDLEDYAKYSQEVYDGFKDMYKEDLEAQKEAWEEKKDAVSEYYDNLREQIENAHDEEDYEKEQSEKRKEIFDLDMQIAELMRDGSEKAKARIAELEEERLKAEEELLDFETDKARENELSRLEKEQKAEEKKIQDKIDGIQGQLDKLDEDTISVRNAIISYARAKGVTLDFAYASGTRSSVGGFGRINEKGVEMISAPDGNGNYIPMLPNSYVFSAKATEFLWKLATEHSLPQAMYNSIARSISAQSPAPSVNIAQPITVTMGDIHIHGNADKQTVADIKRQQDNTVRMVLQRIKELQK